MPIYGHWPLKKKKLFGLEQIARKMKYHFLGEILNYKVKALGIWFSIDPEATATLNREEGGQGLNPDRSIQSPMR